MLPRTASQQGGDDLLGVRAAQECVWRRDACAHGPAVLRQIRVGSWGVGRLGAMAGRGENPAMQRAVHIPLAAQPLMAWANGGGTTRQVAIEPAHASLASGFRWRVSTACVASDGPFSRLPGIDRSLWLLRGNGLRLDVDGCERVLRSPFERFDFAGEARIVARLLDGPIEDLNVMVARDQARADAAVCAFDRGAVVTVPPAAQALLLVLEGRVATACGLLAQAGEALRLDGREPPALRAETAGRVLTVAIWAAGAAP
jgi:environmental stress-induced protein Ves